MSSLNRKAFHDYSVEEKFEAGIVLTGFEVKALRGKSAELTQSSIRFTPRLELVWTNGYIPPYQGTHERYDPRRERKLLLHNAEINRLYGKIQQGGYHLVPLKLYFARNLAKLEIGLARRKKKYDQREDIKKRDIMRSAEQELRADKLKERKA